VPVGVGWEVVPVVGVEDEDAGGVVVEEDDGGAEEDEVEVPPREVRYHALGASPKHSPTVTVLRPLDTMVSIIKSTKSRAVSSNGSCASTIDWPALSPSTNLCLAVPMVSGVWYR